VSDLETIIFKSRAELVASAAQMISEKISNPTSLNDAFHLAITGGTVGTLVLGALGKLTKQADVSNLHIWWVDERFVARHSPDRNELQARDAWLNNSGIQDKNIHPFPASDAETIEEAAASFARTIEQIRPDFDLTLLGMGEDGHVASLFPGNAPRLIGDWVAIETNSPKPPTQRLSLSFAALNGSKEVLFLVSGVEKSQAVSDVMNGKDLPAGNVTGVNKTMWLLDEDAASRITSS
jgi:6-phosphogluconolactonase